MFPSSNCVNVITSPVCSFEDVAYGLYVTAGRIAIASEYGLDVYDKALEKLSSNTTSYDNITFLVLGTYTRYSFWCSGIPTKIPRNPFCAWWRMFNVFVSTYAVAFRTTHGQNKTFKCYTEGFVPVASLYGVVGSPSSFIRSLIGRTRKMWSVVYINVKWTYTYGTLACTIRACATVRNVLQVTSTCPFISWCSGAANIKRTPRVWNSSLNSVKVNCVPASAEILSKSHHPN